MVRSHTVALSLAVVGALLAGCSDQPALDADRSDFDTAAAIWSDPWVAPSNTSLPGPGPGRSGAVSRMVATRVTAYRNPVVEAASQELAAAAAHGWRPTSSSCEEAVDIALVHEGGDGTAHLRVTPERGGSEAVITALVPHHLDTDWAPPAPIPATCLDGEDAVAFEEPPAVTDPQRDDAVPEAEAAQWRRDELSSDEQAVVDALVDDPDLQALGLKVSSPSPSTDDHRRLPVAAEGWATSSLAELRATLGGWELTYAACGGSGPTRATFVNADRTAVVGATIDAGKAALELTGPIAEAPPSTWLADLPPLTSTPCLADAPRDLTVSGTPAVLPTGLTPVAD